MRRVDGALLDGGGGHRGHGGALQHGAAHAEEKDHQKKVDGVPKYVLKFVSADVATLATNYAYQ